MLQRNITYEISTHRQSVHSESDILTAMLLLQCYLPTLLIEGAGHATSNKNGKRNIGTRLCL